MGSYRLAALIKSVGDTGSRVGLAIKEFGLLDHAPEGVSASRRRRVAAVIDRGVRVPAAALEAVR